MKSIGAQLSEENNTTGECSRFLPNHFFLSSIYFTHMYLIHTIIFFSIFLIHENFVIKQTCAKHMVLVSRNIKQVAIYSSFNFFVHVLLFETTIT